MMEELDNDIKNAMLREHERSCAEHGERHASRHEGFAVILEEYEEALGAQAAYKKSIKAWWGDIKTNAEDAEWQLGQMTAQALLAAAAWARVAAMCHKAVKGGP